MRTIRRLYFYAVAFISLEVVLWGMIGLARSLFHAPNVVTSNVDRLAQALALILVGVPVFGFHWWRSQRDAFRDMDDRASGVRAVFLYAALLGTLIPIVQNILALANRTLLGTVRMDTRVALIGGAQTWIDNLLAIIMNILVAAYFITVIRSEWKGSQSKESLTLARRIYRYIWLIYGLVMVVGGTQQTLRFVLNLIPGPFGAIMRTSLVNGVTLLLVGTPIWFSAWTTIQQSLAEQTEHKSLLRLGILYFLSLAGVITVLTAAGTLLDTLLRIAFGTFLTTQQIISRINGPLSIGVPLGGVWAYYGRWLNRTMTETPDTTHRAGMRRLYFYILSIIGLGAAFTGLSYLLSYLINQIIIGTAQISALTGGLAALMTGLPLWLFTWLPMQIEALAEGDAGDHARRSLIRRIYLYLALFASVVGGMAAAGYLFFQIIRSLLGLPQANLAATVLRLGALFLMFAGLGIYHGLTLGRDGKLASAALSAKHAAYPVLLFDPGVGNYTQRLLEAIQKQTPHLPVTIQPVNQPIKPDSPVSAVLLPTDVAFDPPEELRLWLIQFSGSRLAIPRSGAGKWTLTGTSASDFDQAALALRQLAEGNEVRQRVGPTGWMIVVYIAAALFGVEILFTLISLTASFFTN